MSGCVKRRCALVFDDEPDIRQMFSILLESRGYAVRVFEHPGLFLECLNKECSVSGNGCCADVILSDVKMPIMDGLQFMQLLDEKRCPVAARALMSGYWNSGSLKLAHQLHCHIFTKPMRVDEIFDWLSASEDLPGQRQIAT